MKKIWGFTLVIMLSACNNKNENEIVPTKNESKNYRFDFPDTLVVGKNYNGILYYESKLDSISTKIGDTEDYRYSRLLITKTDKIASSNDEIFKKIRDTFWAKNNREILFSNIVFDKVGVFYLEGFVYNLVGAKLPKKDKNGEQMYDMIEEFQPVIHKVIVIDKR